MSIKVIGMTTGTAGIGDTWDMLALDYYDEEMLAPLLLRYNPELDDIIVFEENTMIAVPDIDRDSLAAMPPWRQS